MSLHIASGRGGGGMPLMPSSRSATGCGQWNAVGTPELVTMDQWWIQEGLGAAKLRAE